MTHRGGAENRHEQWSTVRGDGNQRNGQPTQRRNHTGPVASENSE